MTDIDPDPDGNVPGQSYLNSFENADESGKPDTPAYEDFQTWTPEMVDTYYEDGLSI